MEVDINPTAGDTMSQPILVTNSSPNPFRIWACQECPYFFADEEARRDEATGQWGHACKAKGVRKGTRCESFLEAFKPEKR